MTLLAGVKRVNASAADCAIRVYVPAFGFASVANARFANRYKRLATLTPASVIESVSRFKPDAVTVVLRTA